MEDPFKKSFAYEVHQDDWNEDLKFKTAEPECVISCWDWLWNHVKDFKQAVWSPCCTMRERAHSGELWYFIVLRLFWNQVKDCKESVCWSPYCIMRGRAHFGELPKWRQVMFAPPSTITLRHKERIASTSKQACKTKRQTWETRSLQMITNDHCVDIRPNSNNCLALSVRHSSC